MNIIKQKTFILTTLLMIILGFSICSIGFAAGFKTLTAKDLKDKLDSGETVFLLNPLSDLEFNEKHIPGSVNIPLHTIAETTLLPDDKNTLIVTYCLGPK